MEKKELGGAPRNNWLQELNKNSESETEKGQKHQLPVRFESRTLDIIENISKRSGFSKAEAVRRLVSQGLKQRGGILRG
jgi:allophanate hydrolase subunit 1